MQDLECGKKKKKKKNLNRWKMRPTHYRTWNMLRNRVNVKNEKYTLQDLDYGKETLKSGKGATNTV